MAPRFKSDLLDCSTIGFRVCLFGQFPLLFGFRVCFFGQFPLLFGFRVCLFGQFPLLFGFRVCFFGQSPLLFSLDPRCWLGGGHDWFLLICMPPLPPLFMYFGKPLSSSFVTCIHDAQRRVIMSIELQQVPVHEHYRLYTSRFLNFSNLVSL